MALGSLGCADQGGGSVELPCQWQRMRWWLWLDALGTAKNWLGSGHGKGMAPVMAWSRQWARWEVELEQAETVAVRRWKWVHQGWSWSAMGGANGKEVSTGHGMEPVMGMSVARAGECSQ